MKNQMFPDNFLWGSATSAHQVEGNNHNNWTEFEKAGHVVDGQQSGKAVDHWNRFEEDFDLLEDLNLNSYRFSIEWSRIEPEQGKFDQKAIDHYHKMLESLQRRGIEPIVTLHHFTDPIWFGDWTRKDSPELFNSFVKRVAEELGDKVTYWVVINEPMNVFLLAYVYGIWAPGKKSLLAGFKVLRNMIKAHKLAYKTLHEVYESKNLQTPKVGMAKLFNDLRPQTKFPFNYPVVWTVRWFSNHYYVRKVRRQLDWLGVNYYHSFKVKWTDKSSFQDIRRDIGLKKNDMGWNINPEGIFYALKDASRFNLPIIITENGLPDAEDENRKDFIVDHLKYVKQAIDEGVDVIGYQYWSLMDNFEWADGYEPRFGLVEVNYETQARTVRQSARTYSDIAKNNSLEGIV